MNGSFQEIDKWSFDVFVFQEATGEHALKFLTYDLLTRYDLINRYRVNSHTHTHSIAPHTHTHTTPPHTYPIPTKTHIY